MADRAAGRPRLADVALRAGVSKKTVSNVVNDFPFVAEATRERVLKAIEELGYRPNLSARNLARGRTGAIALVIPRLDLPYFSELARHVVEAAEQRSWVVLIEQTKHERRNEQKIIDGELSRRIDGIIFSPTETSAAALRRRADRTPLVLLGEVIYDGRNDHVSIDNVAAARMATNHLLELGCERIAPIGASARMRGATKQRYDGYRQAMEAAGKPVFDLLPPAQRWAGEVGEQVMAQLLDREDAPDGVFCFTDLLALGALRAIHRRGLRVPEDVAVVGFDDIPSGRISVPSLTTIAPDKVRVADLAVDLLEQQVESRRRRPEPREILVDFELVVRESTTRL